MQIKLTRDQVVRDLIAEAYPPGRDGYRAVSKETILKLHALGGEFEETGKQTLCFNFLLVLKYAGREFRCALSKPLDLDTEKIIVIEETSEQRLVDQEDVRRLRELLDRTVEDIGLSVRPCNALNAVGIKTVADVIVRRDSRQKPDGIASILNFGWKSRNELREILASLGLEFEMRIRSEGDKLVLFRPSGETISKFSELRPIKIGGF